MRTHDRKATAKLQQLVRASDATIPLSDPVKAAKAAGLRYVNDAGPGVRRHGAGERVRYVDHLGRRVRDPNEIGRIRSLAIPPAWTHVWICPHANGHLQATGRDVRGRKQYRYHSLWREVRDETKYDRMFAFGRALPVLRKQVEASLALPGLPRDKVLATIVRLLEVTLIRIGNEEYARDNDSFGLTTLHNRHVRVSGDRLHFGFRGKSGVRHAIDVRDPKLARVVKRCRDLPGHVLFSYLDEEGAVHSVDSSDVNEWLQQSAGDVFTAKDFRTWAGTVLAARALCEAEGFESETEAKRNVAAAIESVAARLGNTRAVCRKCYVHPGVIEAYLDGTLGAGLGGRERSKRDDGRHALSDREEALMAFLEGRSSGGGGQSRGVGVAA